MIKKQLLLILALLCAVVQGAWADKWDGVTTLQPFERIKNGQLMTTINSATNLAYIRDHWSEYKDKNLYLTTDIDMGDWSWTPMGDFSGTFYGNGYTIRINIEGYCSNYQGLFSSIASGGTVEDLHVEGSIYCLDSRLVGGIAGCNEGAIIDCWVSADVRSDWAGPGYAKVGGIVGENYSNGQVIFCCMTGNVMNMDDSVGGIAGSNYYGTIQHCTFYGSLTTAPGMWNDNKYAGDENVEEDCHDTYDEAHYDYAHSCNAYMYSYAYRYPYAVNCSSVGGNTIAANPNRAHPGETISLTWGAGMGLERISIKNRDGNEISYSGSYDSGLTFTMPASDANVSAVFNTTDWDDDTKGTASDPYLIDKPEEWTDFVNHVNSGKNFNGKHVRLDCDLYVSQKCGTVSGDKQVNAFSGIFNGNGKTITVNISDTQNQGTALFSYINGATIKDLKVEGTVTGDMHAATLVGFANGTCSIENCTASANVTGGSHIGGILGHGLAANISISRCVFSGMMAGGSSAKGAIVGWGDSGTKTVTNCLYLMANGQNTTGLDLVRLNGGTASVTDTYKTTLTGSYGFWVEVSEPSVGFYTPVTAADGNTYYRPISQTEDRSICQITEDLTITTRIVVHGSVVLNLGAGTTLNATKGIELSRNNSLTINGPGALIVSESERYKPGIGADSSGHLTINSGNINVIGNIAAGIGCETSSENGGGVTINGGVVTARGGYFSPGIGSAGDYVNVPCGDIVINGGQVTAIGNGVNGIGPGGTYAAVAEIPSGTLKLGWTNPDDFVYISSSEYYPNMKLSSITFAEGKQFYLEHTACIATPDNLYGHKLLPLTGALPSLAGEGTESSPYLISNDEDWLLFYDFVARGTNYSGKYVQLNADLTISKSIGVRDDYPFSGTFLGNGHTLTVNLSRTEPGTGPNEQGVAPFHYIKDATIKDLTVAGTITSATRHTSGLVGFAAGTNLIEGCTVNARLRISEDYAGGIIGHGQNSATTIKDCVFSGTFESIIIETGTNARYNIGGIWGWSDSGTATLVNCLEAGNYNSIFSMHPIGLLKAAGTITNCYYVTPQIGSPANVCTVSGARQVFVSFRENEIQELIKVNSTQVYSEPCTISGIAQNYQLTEHFSITPTVTTSANTALIFGDDYTATLNGEAVTTFPLNITEKGEYTLVLTGKSRYVGTKSVAFSVMGVLAGEGTQGSPYLINSAADWKSFVDCVANGTNYSGQFVQLTGDISVSTMVGTSESRPFSGTFLGGGHTITATITDNNGGTALFSNINGATIKNLTVAGTITGGIHAAAIVGLSRGTANNIQNCVATANVSGGSHIGGILGHATNSDIAISGCVFCGTMTGGGAAKGAIVGWGNEGGTKTVTDCLYLMADGQNTNGLDLVRQYGGTISVSNCYKTTNVGSNGKQAYAFATAPANLGALVQDYDALTAYANGIKLGDVYYVAPAIITLADNSDNNAAISDANGYVAEVTLNGRTLYKDGAWNTLCLPFSMDAGLLAASPLAGATIKELTNESNFDGNGVLMLKFQDATNIEAGKPYIIKWTSGANIVSPVFSGVTISHATDNDATFAGGAFRGTYAPVEITDENRASILLLAGNNTLGYAKTDRTVANGKALGAFRAYFHIPGQQAVRSYVLDFGEGETTGIVSVENSSRFTPHSSPSDCFTLDGRKLAGEPTEKGVYIVNGRKVVVK